MADELAERSRMLRLELLRGIYSALSRSEEVLAVVGASEDRNEATAAVQSLLGLDRTQAEAVLGLGWNDLAKNRIQEIADEIVRVEGSSDTDLSDSQH